jgi:hypothetical protein
MIDEDARGDALGEFADQGMRMRREERPEDYWLEDDTQARCAECGRSFIATHRPGCRDFCSSDCRNAYIANDLS